MNWFGVPEIEFLGIFQESAKNWVYGKINRAFLFFRAIFDLLNKIALLILRRMFALYVEKAKNWKLIVEW